MIHIHKSRQMAWNAITTYFFDKSLGPIPQVFMEKRYYNRRFKSIKMLFSWSKKVQNIAPWVSGPHCYSSVPSDFSTSIFHYKKIHLNFCVWEIMVASTTNLVSTVDHMAETL